MRWRPLVTIAVVAVAYAVLGRLSVRLAIPPGFAAPVWPAAGVAIVAALLGRRAGLPRSSNWPVGRSRSGPGPTPVSGINSAPT